MHTLKSRRIQNESLFGADFGPFFFENEQVKAVTVNGDRYWAMLKKFLFTKIEVKDIGNSWFQQGGATYYTAKATLDVLRPVFEDRISRRRADVVLPSRTCDLTPLDYYLWDAVKDKCYADKPQTIDALKDNIREAICEIQLHTIDYRLKNWTDRVAYCMTSQGSHLNEIICALLTARIVLSNKKRNFEKIFSRFF